MSRLDQLYRRLLLTKFFTKGWGKPDSLKRIFDFRKIMSDREICKTLVPKDYPIHIDKEYPDGDCRILEGHFLSPLTQHLPGIMPKEVEMASFQMILPKQWKHSKLKPVCIHLAGTGDHFFWRRRLLMAKPLLKDSGIASILLENPYYGTRKPKGQLRSSLHNVSDLFVMGGALILECQALLHWCRNQGYGPLGLTGISMGGHMASLAATNWDEPISLIPCLSWSTASIVFTQGVMSGAIPWKTLEAQFFENSVYQDEISKLIVSPEQNNGGRSAYEMGQTFVKQFSQHYEQLHGLHTGHGDTRTSHGDTRTDHGDTRTSHGDTRTDHGDTHTGRGDTRTSHGDTHTGRGDMFTHTPAPDHSPPLGSFSKPQVALHGDLSNNMSHEVEASLGSFTPSVNSASGESSLLDRTLMDDASALGDAPSHSDAVKKADSSAEGAVGTAHGSVSASTVPSSPLSTSSVSGAVASSSEALTLKHAMSKSKLSRPSSSSSSASAPSSPPQPPRSETLQHALSKAKVSRAPGASASDPPSPLESGSALQREAINFMVGVMDECTHLGNFSVPVDPRLVIIVAAEEDAYIPRRGVIPLPRLWPGAQVRYLANRGHIAAFLLNNDIFRKAIADSFDKQIKLYYPS